VVDGGEPGVDSRDEGKHTGRNDLLFVERSADSRCCNVTGAIVAHPDAVVSQVYTTAAVEGPFVKLKHIVFHVYPSVSSVSF